MAGVVWELSYPVASPVPKPAALLTGNILLFGTTCCLLHLSVLTPPRNTLTPSALCCLKHQAPTSSMASCNPSMGMLCPSCPVPSSGRRTWPLASLAQWFILSGRSYWAHITFFGSVCTSLVLNYPHHLPTKALWQQRLFPIAHLGKCGEENQLGLCWWKSGPDFLQSAKPTVTQERQSSSWLHANLIVRLLNGFKWV